MFGVSFFDKRVHTVGIAVEAQLVLFYQGGDLGISKNEWGFIVEFCGLQVSGGSNSRGLISLSTLLRAPS